MAHQTSGGDRIGQGVCQCHPRRVARRRRGARRLPRRQARHPSGRRDPPPRPAGHPGPTATPWAHRGRKDDPLYKIRGLLRTGLEHASLARSPASSKALDVGDPDWEVTIAWGCYQGLRPIYHQHTTAAGKKIAEEVIATLHTCPIPEVARLGRTPRAWRTQVLAYFDTDGVSNGGTEAMNLIIEKTRRLAHGFRTFARYRLRILLAASADRPWRTNHA